MLRRHKKFSRPRKLYDISRITDENKLVEKFGLKNKREIWKTEAKVRYFRNRAKELITASEKEQQTLFGKLTYIGIPASSIADVLALTKEDLLKRRLASILVDKNMASTAREARQMIVHKRVRIDGKAISSPSYLVPVSEENLLTIKTASRKPAVAKSEESSE